MAEYSAIRSFAHYSPVEGWMVMCVCWVVVDSVVGNCTSSACGHVALVGDPDYTCRMDSVPWRGESGDLEGGGVSVLKSDLNGRRFVSG